MKQIYVLMNGRYPVAAFENLSAAKEYFYEHYFHHDEPKLVIWEQYKTRCDATTEDRNLKDILQYNEGGFQYNIFFIATMECHS
jgi:hypothetical protein